MHRTIELITTASRDAARFVLRDYFELENLQHSSKNISQFVQKSCQKAAMNLHNNLSKYYSEIIFNEADLNQLGPEIKQVAIIKVLDGVENFSKAIPFFAIMITIMNFENNEWQAKFAALNFPVLGEIYYAEQGKGAWREKLTANVSGTFRIRASNNSDMQTALWAVTNGLTNEQGKISQKRDFGSDLYHLVLFCSGKIDAAIFAANPLIKPIIMLFVKEAGGKIQAKQQLLYAGQCT